MAVNRIVPFEDFIREVRAARHETLAAADEARVASVGAFEAMKRHVLNLYEGVEVRSSFEDDSGNVIDCIPIEQQPALRGRKLAEAPPDLPVAASEQSDASGDVAEPVRGQLTRGARDRFGNEQSCPKGCVPIMRVTLEMLSRFETLQDFFRKAPGGGSSPTEDLTAMNTQTVGHRYAYGMQTVNNLGGQSFLNLWEPTVGSSQTFSLSQQWYQDGSGSSLQTAEVGWQVYPGLYGDQRSHLFIYWTADGYQTTGCYNLTCTAFVQTNPGWVIGGGFTNLSTPGGAQYELEMSFYLTGGNWWLFLGGNSSADAVGYYPGTLYGTGPMATAAAIIIYGGETTSAATYPPMGSGQFANAGYQQACYQKNILYFPTGGGTQTPNLTLGQATPACYTAMTQSLVAPWNYTLWFGGPGGTC